MLIATSASTKEPPSIVWNVMLELSLLNIVAVIQACASIKIPSSVKLLSLRALRVPYSRIIVKHASRSIIQSALTPVQTRPFLTQTSTLVWIATARVAHAVGLTTLNAMGVQEIDLLTTGSVRKAVYLGNTIARQLLSVNLVFRNV